MRSADRYGSICSHPPSRRSKNARRRAMRHVPLMRPAALEGGAARVVARQVLEEAAEDSAIVIAAQIETEKGAVRAWRDEVQGAVQPRVGRRTHVHVLEQAQQAVPVRLVAAHPTVEVEALGDRVALARLVKLMDLPTVPGTHQHVRQRRAHVAQRNVMQAAQVRERVDVLEPSQHLRTGDGVLERTSVVIRVATIAQVAALAGFPESLMSQAPQRAGEDRLVTVLLVAVVSKGVVHNTAQVEVDHRHAVQRRAGN